MCRLLGNLAHLREKLLPSCVTFAGAEPNYDGNNCVSRFVERFPEVSMLPSPLTHGPTNSEPTMDLRNRRFVELLGKYEHSLNAFVLALVPHWSDADEIVQLTRIRLWEQFDRYDPNKDFGAWARTIAYYEILSHRKNKKSARRLSLLTENVIEKLASEADYQGDIALRQHALSKCLEQLSPAQRDLLRSCYSGERSIQELASGLGRTFNAVRQLLFRLRKNLYRCIERRMALQHKNSG
jgi:RNA polymerase sigma-70 factor (ECF subfamily)